jgi:hypothetical protein
MSNNEKEFVFDEWDEFIDCDECRRFWDDTCDGVAVGSQKLCKGFLATRKVDIPLKVNRLQRDVNYLTKLAYIGFAWLGLLSIGMIAVIGRLL